MDCVNETQMANILVSGILLVYQYGKLVKAAGVQNGSIGYQ